MPHDSPAFETWADGVLSVARVRKWPERTEMAAAEMRELL